MMVIMLHTPSAPSVTFLLLVTKHKTQNSALKSDIVLLS